MRDWWKKLKKRESNLFSFWNERKCGKKQQHSEHQICRQNIRHHKFIREHHIRCYVKISEVATLVSTIPNFWCWLEVGATELHLCFVIKGNAWWKRTFLRMATIVVLHHKHMKLFKPFIQHNTAWSVRKGFIQSIRRTKEQKTRLQCSASARCGLRLRGAPGWNLEGALCICKKLSLIGKKINERIEVFLLLKQKKLQQKTNG